MVNESSHSNGENDYSLVNNTKIFTLLSTIVTSTTPPLSCQPHSHIHDDHIDHCDKGTLVSSFGDSARISYILFYSLIIVLTLSGYLIVLPFTYAKKKVSYSLIVSLACADVYQSCVMVPIRIVEANTPSWLLHWDSCRYVACLSTYGCAVTSLNMLAVSLDRVLFFAMPFRYQGLVTMKLVRFSCVFIFVISTAAFLPLFSIGSKATNHNELPHCMFTFMFTDKFIILMSCFFYVIPTILTMTIQVVILKMTSVYFGNHRDHLRSNPRKSTREVQMQMSVKRELRIQRMFLMIVVMNFICWGPFVIVLILVVSEAVHDVPRVAYDVIRILLFSNCFCNAWLIVLSNVKIMRKCFQRIYSTNSLNTQTS